MYRVQKAIKTVYHLAWIFTFYEGIAFIVLLGTISYLEPYIHKLFMFPLYVVAGVIFIVFCLPVQNGKNKKLYHSYISWILRKISKGVEKFEN